MSDSMAKRDQLPGDLNPYNEIDLRALLTVLWLGRGLISVITVVATAISVAVALSLPNIYTASALLIPAERASSGASSLIKQYGGLATLAGISLPSGSEGSRTDLGMQLMTSRAFIADFVARRDVLPELMAVESWDWRSGEIIFNPDLYDVASEMWVREVDPPKQAKPSAQEAHDAFLKMLNVSEDEQTGYVTVSVDHESPVVAARWVTWLVEDVNLVVKAQDVAEAEDSIAYLKQQVDNTSLADLQALFFELIQSQMETVMLAKVRPEYVFKTIDPAVVPEEKSKPRRLLICALGILVGGILGIALVIFRHLLESQAE